MNPGKDYRTFMSSSLWRAPQRRYIRATEMECMEIAGSRIGRFPKLRRGLQFNSINNQMSQPFTYVVSCVIVSAQSSSSSVMSSTCPSQCREQLENYLKRPRVLADGLLMTADGNEWYNNKPLRLGSYKCHLGRYADTPTVPLVSYVPNV